MFSRLGESDKVSVIENKEEDVKDYDGFLGNFYWNFVKKVKINHIFGATNSQVGNKFLLNLRRRNLPDHKVDPHDAVEENFERRSDYHTFDQAMSNQKKSIKDSEGRLLKGIAVPGINIYKQVELHKNYMPLIPHRYWHEPLYKKPSKSIVNAVKREKKDRKVFRSDLNEKKKSVMRKGDMKAKVEDMAIGGQEMTIGGQAKIEDNAVWEGSEV